MNIQNAIEIAACGIIAVKMVALIESGKMKVSFRRWTGILLCFLIAAGVGWCIDLVTMIVTQGAPW